MESIPIRARREFLDDLIEGLTTSEWRYLRDRLTQRHLYFDVFGKLPLEIALSVAAYLDPLDVVAMRRVSKSWHSLLTIDDVSKQVALSQWPQQNRLASECWTNYLNQRLCCEHSLACGRPWSKADYVDRSLNRNPMHMSKLYGSNFAWCVAEYSPHLREHIAVLSLETGITSRFFPSTRARLWGLTIALSNCLVGCLSSDGHCEIFNLQTEACYSFRLPSTKLNKLVIQDDKVACINLDPTSCSSVLSSDITTWNLTSRGHRHTSLVLPVQSNLIRNATDAKLTWILGYDSIYLVERGESTVVWVNENGMSIFEALDADISLDVCRVSEISLGRNEIMASHVIRIDNPRSNRLFANDCLSAPGHDPVVLPLQEVLANWCSYLKLASKNCWVYSIDPLHFKDGPLDGRLRDVVAWPTPVSLFTCQRTLKADDGYVGIVTWHQDQQTIKMIKPDISEGESLAGITHRPPSRVVAHHGRAKLTDTLWHTSLCEWYGNQRFFIVPYYQSIRVYCFDKDFVLANEDFSYRRDRGEKAEARKAKRLLQATRAV